jgi:hypothetical protein
MELRQIIGPHQPDEAPAGIAADQRAQGVDGIDRCPVRARSRSPESVRGGPPGWPRHPRGQRAMPCAGLSTLPGETSHHTSSSPSAHARNRLTRRWPPCAGLKLPPRRPVSRVCRVSGPDRPLPWTSHH